MKVAVVIATWSGADPADLARLLDGLAHHPAGHPHDVALCINGAADDVPAALRARVPTVWARENRGFNLGAWQHAWRHLPEHDAFLFLQDDCFIRRGGWLAPFVRRMTREPAVGLVAEHLHASWDEPWGVLCALEGPKGERARAYRGRLQAWGVPLGTTARHATSVVQFTTRRVLEATGGYLQADDYEGAVAAEIAFSRRVEAAGRTLAQVARYRHRYVGHPQWPRDDPWSRLKRSARKRLGRGEVRKRPHGG